MAIYQDQHTPYFYIIQDKRNGMYYAGAKWAKDANPAKLMGEYTTSSGIINEIVSSHGVDVFAVRKIRVFDDAQKAQHYETRFLRKVNAKQNPMFYNGHNNDGAMDQQKTKLFMLEKYGVEHYSKTEEYKEKIRSTSLERYGVEHVLQSSEIRDKGKMTNLQKYGAEHPMKSSTVRDKGRKTCLEKYGVENVSQSEAFIEMKRQNSIERYGVSHPQQTVEARMKLSEIAKKREEEKSARPNVLLLKQYIEKYGSKEIGCGRGWFRKSDDYLLSLIEDATTRFGKL